MTFRKSFLFRDHKNVHLFWDFTLAFKCWVYQEGCWWQGAETSLVFPRLPREVQQPLFLPGGPAQSTLWPTVSCRQFQKAENHFSMAIQHNPQKPQYYLYRARSRQLLQNIFGARQDVATVLLLDPKQPKVCSCWARRVGSRVNTSDHLKIHPVPKRNLDS